MPNYLVTQLPELFVGSTNGELILHSNHGVREPIVTANTGATDATLFEIAHRVNAYPKLVEALVSFLRAPAIGSSGPGSITLEVQSFNREAAVALLRDLGEAS